MGFLKTAADRHARLMGVTASAETASLFSHIDPAGYGTPETDLSSLFLFIEDGNDGNVLNLKKGGVEGLDRLFPGELSLFHIGVKQASAA